MLSDLENNIGDRMDPENEQDNKDRADEGVEKDERFVYRDPEGITF